MRLSEGRLLWDGHRISAPEIKRGSSYVFSNAHCVLDTALGLGDTKSGKRIHSSGREKPPDP